MKPVVLVTAIGTAASTAIVTALRAAGGFYIIGGDINLENQVVTSKDVDEFYTFPSAVGDQNEYIDFAVRFCREHNVSFYFPTIDEEVVNLSKNRNKFEAAGVRLCVPNEKLIEICHNKDRFSAWIEENLPQISIKAFHSFNELTDADFPVFIKPVHGRAGIGCRKIESRAQLEQLLADGMSMSEYVVQPFISGEVISVDMARNAKTGQKIRIQRVEELRNSNGCGIAVRIINDEKLAAVCDELMEKLELNGVVNAEFFRFDGRFGIIEVNPRFPAGTCFSVAAGVNTPLNALEIAAGRECSFGTIAFGTRLAKRYETYIMS